MKKNGILIKPKLSDLLGQYNAMIDWMPDQVRHDRNPLGLVRHSGESPDECGIYDRNPAYMSPHEIKIAQFR